MAATVDQTQPMNYGHAPITEAVIHLRTSNVVNETERKKVARRLKALYPNSHPLRAFSINISATGGPNVAAEQEPQGIRLTSEDETHIVLIQRNGVVISRLAPYPGWKKFRERAISVWAEWRAATSSPPVSRIGIRYINRIDIPYANRLTQGIISFSRRKTLAYLRPRCCMVTSYRSRNRQMHRIG